MCTSSNQGQAAVGAVMASKASFDLYVHRSSHLSGGGGVMLLLRLEICFWQLWFPPWPRCPRSGMLISGHCPPLAVSLSRPWSSMWPCVFVSVGTAISPVVLMWWTYRISCSRQVNIWICLIRSRSQMFLVIRLMRNWLKSR